MSLLKSVSARKIIIGTISPVAIVCTTLVPHLTAQSSPQRTASVKFPPVDSGRGAPKQTIGAGGRLIEFPPAEDRGNPKTTVGGGTRGVSSCTEKGKTPLMSLMPTRNNIATTVAANPTLYLYVPKTDAKVAEFVMIDSLGNDVYVTTLDLANQSGVMKVSVPANISLKIGQDYQWQFTLLCDSEEQTNEESVQGVLRRTELSRATKFKLGKADVLNQAKIYAESRIWVETLNLAAQLRTSRPQVWEDLLDSVGLQAIAKEPFIASQQQ